MAKESRSQKRSAAKANRDGAPINSPGAPAESSEAGDAGDVGHRHTVENVKRHRASAVRHLRSAQRLADQDRAAADQEARSAIVEIVHAFWWAEDSELEDDQHTLMHEIGLWTRQRFGCSLPFDGKRYQRRCPIDIAHKRFGFSVGYTATAICSICGEDVSECPHLPEADCQHRADRIYRVTLTKIITKMDVREISLVSRQAGVTIRLLGISVDNADLIEALGPDFEVGMPISCDKCLNGCWSIGEFDPPTPPYDRRGRRATGSTREERLASSAGR